MIFMTKAPKVLKTACCAASLITLIAPSSAVSAGEAPSNAELFKMLKTLQAQQQQLIDQVQTAKAETARAKAELAKARRQIANNKAGVKHAQQKIAAADVKIDKVVTDGITIAAASTNLPALAVPGGQVVMGSGSFPGAVRTAPQPMGVYASLTLKYLMGNNDGMDFAVLNSTTSLGNVTGNDGPLQSLGDNWAPAYGITVGSNMADGTDVRASLNYYRNDTTETLVFSGGAIQATQVGPNSQIDENSLNAAGDFARGSLDRKVLTVGAEIGKTLAVGEDLKLRVSTGVQVADIDNKLSAYYYDIGANDSHITTQDNNIRAYGARLGLETNWRASSSVSFGLSLGAALYYAERDYKITQMDNGGGPVPNSGSNLLNFSSDESFVMPALDAEASVTWQTILGNHPTAITLGYNLQTWMDVNKDVRQVDDVDENVFTVTNNDLTLHGPFLRATISMHRDEPALK